jgi:protein-S-isoprenylcysteine O-methyltransferase Ste14
MSIIADVLIIVGLFSLFSSLHTFLASTKVKTRIREKVKDGIAFYRLFYNISSLITFIIFYTLSPKPDVVIYDLEFPIDIIVFILQVAALAGFFVAGAQTDIKEFLGISQIIRYSRNKYDINELDEKHILITKGLYKYSRHPVYFFAILFLALRPAMDLFYLTFLLCMICYFYVGSFYEEKKLISNFGVKYLEYQKSVPRIIPKIF